MTIERERNNAKVQQPISIQERITQRTTNNSNRYRDVYPDTTKTTEREIPMLKIMFGVAFGIVLAALAILGINLMFVQEILKPFQPNQQEKELSAYQAEVKLERLKQEQQQVLQQRAIQAQRAEEAIRSERQHAENAARDAQQERSFKDEYKKPAECYDIQNHETRMNCANHYIRAKAAFAKKLITMPQDHIASQ